MPATSDQVAALEADPLKWRLTLFEPYLTDALGQVVPDAPHHRRYWTWLWSLRRGVRPRPLIAIWARGGAKSTNAEMGTIALAARGHRRYGWYVSGIQDQADDHVVTIAGMLESDMVATFYPQLGQRRISKFGHSRGWRVNRLRTASGFTIDAIGLDKAVRGVKVDMDRPDFLILDDVDATHDSADTVIKKLRTITNTLIPAGATDLAILGIQNLVHPDSVFAQIAAGATDVLSNRLLLGPVPAIDDLTYIQRGGRFRITGGNPTWIGQDQNQCQALIDEIGITAFLEECQHEVEAPAGGMFSHIDMAGLRVDPAAVPELTRVECWVDPAVTKTDRSDSQAIQIDGIAGDATTGTIYRLYSWEQRATPLEAIMRALLMAARFGALYVGVETDQGGETWESVWREAKTLLLGGRTAEIPVALQRRMLTDLGAKNLNPDVLARIRRIRFKWAKAGQGQQPKAERASMMLADYERPGRRIRHVIGTHLALERALNRFPLTAPLDLTDAAYWSWNDLRNQPVAFGANTDADEPQGQPGPDDDPYAARRQSRWMSG